MAITGYKLRVNGGSLIDEIIDVGLVYEYTIEDLETNTTYQIEIASYSGIAQSEWSDPIEVSLGFMMLVDGDGNALVDGDGNALIVPFSA